jgi:AcrR family transcriptional regulator
VEQAVLRCVLDELAEHGLEGLRVERVAARAEVNKTSIYRRWPTREALVEAALARVHGAVAREAGDRGSLRADLEALARSAAALLASPQGRALMLSTVSGSGALAAGSRRRLARQAGSELDALMDRARHRGEWREGTSSRSLLSLLVGGVVHRVFVEQAPVNGRWLTDTVALLMDGASARSGAERRRDTAPRATGTPRSRSQR